MENDENCVEPLTQEDATEKDLGTDAENEDGEAQESKTEEFDFVETPRQPTEEEAYETDLEQDDLVRKKYRSLSAEDIYRKSCEHLGVVPASYFFAHIHEEVMNMSHHGLGPNGTKAIAAPLVINTSILELNIADNWMTAEGMRDIADMLMDNCYISSLNISDNKLGTKGAKYVCEMIQENATLKVLNVARNGFKDSEAQYFEEAMRMNFKLKELDLSGNKFCEVGGEWLGQAIAANEALEYLNLSWNHLRMKGALAICAGMKSNITLKSLDLSWNGFADEGAMAMGEALKANNSLTWLDLSFNRITDRGALALAKGLEVNDTLKTLRIGNNPLGKEGPLAIISAILKNEKSAVEDLDLSGIRVSKEFKELAKRLKERALTSGSSKTSFNVTASRAEEALESAKDKTLTSEKADPMLVIQKFLEDKRLRLVDLFRSFDKDLSWKISPDEFKNGILDAGIPFTKTLLKQLMENLDLDADGQINYRELLRGKKKAVLRRREIRKREEENRQREKQEENKFLSIWSDTVKATSREGLPANTPVRRSSVELRVEPLMENKQLARLTAAKLSMVSNSRSTENSSTADFGATSPRQQASPLEKQPQDKPKSSMNRS